MSRGALRRWTLSAALLAAAPAGEARAAEVLTLADCVARALTASPELAGARAGREQARRRRLAALGRLGPEAAFSASKTLWGHNEAGARTNPGAGTPDDYELLLSGSWELFDNGRRWLALRERTEDLAASDAGVTAARRRVEDLAVTGYYAVLLASRSVQVERENLFLIEELEARVGRLYQRGARGAGDVLKAEVAVRQARIAVLRAEALLGEALARLNVLLGAAPDRALSLEEAAEPVAAPEPLERCLEVGQARRGEVGRARHAAEAAGAAVRRARAEAFPVLSLLPSVSHGLGDPARRPNPQWRVALGLSVPVWDGTGRFQELRRAQAEADLRASFLEAARRRVAEEVAAARVRLAALRDIYEHTRSQVGASERSRRLMLDTYERGNASTLELTEAQAELARLKLQMIATFYSYHVAAHALRNAMGLDWEGR